LPGPRLPFECLRRETQARIEPPRTVRERTAETISFTLDDFRRAASFPLTHTIAVPKHGETSPTAVQKRLAPRAALMVGTRFESANA
jgi:hypothetical protein